MTPPRQAVLAGGQLQIGAVPVLHGLSSAWSVVDDPSGGGVFLQGRAAEPACYAELPLGRITGLRRFTSGHRFSPFWTRPANGSSEGDVKPETLWLLAQTGAARFVLIVPLLDGAQRYSLRSQAGELVVAAETGDPALPCGDGVALLVVCGDDPYALTAAGARALRRHLGSARLRTEKPLPDIVDRFGWCTWDAFYKDVSAGQVLAGLAAFAQAGIEPRWMILDDGWQTWERAASGEDRLTSLDPNPRFGGDLGPLVREVKQRFRIERFLVWHALLGYWGGLSESALPGYGTRTVARAFGPGMLEQDPRWNVQPWGAQAGVPAAGKIGAFYDELHRRLARQGVDGVKVDVQALLESLAAGQGGRLALARAVRSALESSVAKHFDGRLINCMSCTSECAYLAAGSVLMRTSDDFFPQRPESHGLHLHANAQAGVWFGEFMLPDWDMFQSSHERGEFHAAARAISGGPVYVSDKPGLHDAALLRKLVLSDGSVLRAEHPARPTPDNLFADPTREPVLLKVFNSHRDAAVVGLFNAHHGSPDGGRIEGTVAPCDVPTLAAGGHAAYAQRADRVWRCAFDQTTAFALAQGEWELVSFAPVEHGFAALGLADKFNGIGAITQRSWHDGACHVSLRDGGRFVAWAHREPEAMQDDGEPLAFAYEFASGTLTADLPAGRPRTVVVQWPAARPGEAAAPERPQVLRDYL